ncbi:hypothetical protein LINPERHAP1_LOCUS20052 [Linum perenne]
MEVLQFRDLCTRNWTVRTNIPLGKEITRLISLPTSVTTTPWGVTRFQHQIVDLVIFFATIVWVLPNFDLF